ncbi:sel1 repeat family protein [Salinimonas marina]|uniref:Sel1 repeat family protein n=1 Tax=Salinimonas marina TaxID=2785918 RepID=A0A7S9DV73_9ALTE|nr:sel1 repeat family protein [Salinimonas marina]QPG04368.1 sel1 repeat family protein [Salinimonas marina]
MRGLIIALLAMVLVSADTAHYVPQLLANAQSSQKPAPLLWRASLTGSPAARAQLTDFAIANHKPFWLNKLVGLKHAPAAWALYQQAPLHERQPYLLQLAARGGVAEAQLALAMSTEDAQIRERWLLKGAKQAFQPAQAALADWYLLNQQPEKARPWLKATAGEYPASAYHLGRLLWDEGKHQQGRALIGEAASRQNPLARRLEQVLSSYQPQSVAQVKSRAWPQNRQCLQRIQMFATSLSSIERASELYTNFHADKRLQALPICLQRPVWLTQNTLKCSNNWQKTDRLGCDVRPLADAIEARDATHAIVVADLGKANVNNGVMFLDLSDSYSVMVHELAHFAGFVDEYPLGSAMASRYCNGKEIPNLVFDGKLTYAPFTTLTHWQGLAPNLKIAPAKTCQGHDRQAYKPSDKITFLEHHDSGVIPDLYLKLWRQQLGRPNAQRPIFMNLFQSFHYAGNTPQAGKWLKKYQDFNQPAPAPAPPSSPEPALQP